MIKLLKAFENKKPLIVFEWNDLESNAQGWVVINSLIGGAAGGGTRMREGINQREVEMLAKTMEIKFSFCGPQIGGAKSGINFNPNDPQKKDVLKRWYKAISPLLKYYYGTGGDMNVDEIEDVIPLTEEYGLWHPQEGIVSGHFSPTDTEKIVKIGQLRSGVSKIIEIEKYSPDINYKYTISDMITGYGVAQSILHYYNIYGGDVTTKRAIIQGWGNVGAATGFYLAQAGVKIIGIADKAGSLSNSEGFSLEEIKSLFINRKTISSLPHFSQSDAIWKLDSEIFIPAAASKLIGNHQLERMINNKLELISCGANVPFNDEEIFYGKTLSKADQTVSVIPDFIANCGMARVFAFLMKEKQEITSENIFNDVSNTIEKAIMQSYAINQSKTGITKTFLQIALDKLT